jgi:hypothetical protein
MRLTLGLLQGQGNDRRRARVIAREYYGQFKIMDYCNLRDCSEEHCWLLHAQFWKRIYSVPFSSIILKTVRQKNCVGREVCVSFCCAQIPFEVPLVLQIFIQIYFQMHIEMH